MDPAAEKMVLFLREEIIRDPSLEIDADTPLLSQGLIDSFDLVEILWKLEEVCGVTLPTGRVGPQQLDSVTAMLATVARLTADAETAGE